MSTRAPDGRARGCERGVSERLLPESQGQNLAVTVFNVPYLLDSNTMII